MPGHCTTFSVDGGSGSGGSRFLLNKRCGGIAKDAIVAPTAMKTAMAELMSCIPPTLAVADELRIRGDTDVTADA
jgi:hypothetical protein